MTSLVRCHTSDASTVQFKYNDKDVGKSWDFSGHYTNLKLFDLSQSKYAQRRMLG